MPDLRESLAAWAGIECTVNRVGDRYLNQCEKNGHDVRLDDLARFASLGVSRIRYPFLWETIAPGAPGVYRWDQADRRAAELRKHGLVPIAGLLHHGSGPRYTDLIDPRFPELFAEFARAFAERYPWIEDYTPINEPLTTARFSGLYGFWYPHGRDDRLFVRALLHQVRATRLAMRAIRRVNPRARLIQTEDLGRISGTEPLKYQVDFENERRWLSFDLLTGKVGKEHPLRRYLIGAGATDAELAELENEPCPPDLLGVNHYLLSNRYLDHRLDLYPEMFHGGNGRDQYADVGGVDAGPERGAEFIPPGEILREAFARYAIPVAVTEVHVRGGREAQLRWLHEVWSACETLRREGVGVRAVTAWSLLGSYDWNSLCTRTAGFYEPGVFDIRAREPRPTALARMLRDLSDGKPFRHPVLEREGWWRRPPTATRTPILIVGSTGTLGRAFARLCEERGLDYRLVGRREMDIANATSVRRMLDETRPWAVINAAGYVRLDDAEIEAERCYCENLQGPETVAALCGERRIRFVNFSSDMVFDGRAREPYREDAPVSPINVYGRSKADAERAVLGAFSEALVVRTSAFFGPWDEANFVVALLRTLAAGKNFRAANDLTISPTYVPDLVHSCLDLLIDGEGGVVHLTNEGHLTWADFAEMAARQRPELDRGLIERCKASELNWRASRPSFSALQTDRARILPAFDDALSRFFRESEVPIAASL